MSVFIEVVMLSQGRLYESGSGYFRQPDGPFVVFDAPGAGTGPGQGTDTDGINAEHLVPGPYYHPNGVIHGYIRFPDGSITEFDVPGTGTAVAGHRSRRSQLRGEHQRILYRR